MIRGFMIKKKKKAQHDESLEWTDIIIIIYIYTSELNLLSRFMVTASFQKDNDVYS